MNLIKTFLTILLFFISLSAQQTSAPLVFAYMAPSLENQWHTAVAVPFAAKSFSGNMNKGVIFISGSGDNQCAFNKDIMTERWEITANPPFAVKRCSGDNAFGPIVFGGADDRQVAYLRDYKANIWIALQAAPFKILDLAGDNSTGPIIAGGDNHKKVAYMRDYKANEWKVVADAPFEVSCVAGDNVKGILVAGGTGSRQVAFMRDYSLNIWNIIADAPFAISGLAGTNEKGPIIIGGANNSQVAFMDDYKSNKWKIVANAPVNSIGIAGTLDRGIIVLGKELGKTSATNVTDASSNIKVRQQVMKAAVVEFSERGNLGIQDAGAIIAEWLTTALNKTGAFEVYERLSLSSIMQEHQLNQSGMLDDATIAEVGKMKGVEAIITGSIVKFGDIISVTAKVIDVETAKIIKSTDIKVNDINSISSEIEKLAWELARE
jgi:TolB-like protein